MPVDPLDDHACDCAAGAFQNKPPGNKHPVVFFFRDCSMPLLKDAKKKEMTEHLRGRLDGTISGMPPTISILIGEKCFHVTPISALGLSLQAVLCSLQYVQWLPEPPEKGTDEEQDNRRGASQSRQEFHSILFLIRRGAFLERGS